MARIGSGCMRVAYALPPCAGTLPTPTLGAMDAATLRAAHTAGLTYAQYLATDVARARPWHEVAQRVSLAAPQRSLLAGFTRRMPVICLSGIWCGDCSAQGPMLAAIADACPMVDLRWLDRDEHPELSERVTICGGRRVPTVIWMSEDFEFVSLLGDRTISRYRAMAARALGASCPLPGAPLPDDEIAATVADWVCEFERVQLLLRLSPRLRQKHGD